MIKLKNYGWVIIALFLISILFTPRLEAVEKKPMNFVDVINVKRIYSMKVSPDGSQMIFTISKADWERNEYVTHIWRINTNGTGLVQMTNGKTGESRGEWSPDGKYIAFIAKRNKDSQIHLLNNSGGEAIEFTQHKGGVRSFQWSPSGDKIYFLSADPLSDEEEKKKKAKDDAFIFEHNYQHRHLWIMDLKSKKEKRLTEGDFSILDFKISNKEGKIIYAAAPTPLYDDTKKSEIWVMNLPDRSKKQITKNNIPEGNIELSPDNKQIIFVADSNERFEDYYQSQIFVVSIEGGTPKPLIKDFPYEVYQATWSKNGNKIIFNANMGVHCQLFTYDLKKKKIIQLTNGQHALYGFQYIPKIDTIAYTLVSPHNPATFWSTNLSKFKPRMIYDPYPDLKKYKLAKYESVKWKSTDNKTVEGILIYPVDYVKGKRYPLLAHTHGGPMGSDKFTFDGYAHARAGRGYAILKPNYRGSTGYGNEVLRDMVGHYFLHADDDVITGVDYLVERGIADPHQLGTLGWSAGGHMTNWLITHTTKFKAASSGAGASNWISMYAQSDVRIYRTPWFLGDPWHKDSPLQTFREHSPIFYVHQAKTPTLIMYGENDRRVPLPQGVELYRGLKANNVPTELVIFPRAGHGPRELRHRLYKMNKEFQWLEKYIRGKNFKFDKPPQKDKKKKKERDTKS
jgi:dipeptidyl aminopeptidase/acylaminoacyl peptidase